MSVLLETSLGDLVLDLDVERAPQASTNFLKLCKLHRYTYGLFHDVQRGFIAQTGRYGAGEGTSIWHLLPRSSTAHSPSPWFEPEVKPALLNHAQRGTVSMALSPAGPSPPSSSSSASPRFVAGSQFFITLADGISYLDGKHGAPFARVVEGDEEGGTLDRLNAALTDDAHRPMRDVRIRHVVVLDDPFPDPEGMAALLPSRTPSPTPEQLASLRLGDGDADADGQDDLVDGEHADGDGDDDARQEARRKADSSAAALTLEMVGDLPFAEVRPPENVLFVCKLNPVTRSQDLELIFSRFGSIASCQVIRDRKTGDSLQYAFIEFEHRQDAERAYAKMDSVLVDNQRIRVDFSQSVSKLHARWVQGRTGARQRQPAQAQAQAQRAYSGPSPSSSTPQPPRSRWDSHDGPAHRDTDGPRRRERSPPRVGGRAGDRDYARQRGGDRDRDRDRDGDYGRDRNRDRHREYRERDRERDRDRDREYHSSRDRDRDRDRHRYREGDRERDRDSDRDRDRDRHRHSHGHR